MAKLKIISTLYGGRILSLYFEENNKIEESTYDESVVDPL